VTKSFGEHLVEQVLPAEYHGRGPLTKSKLNEVLVDIAKKQPEHYADIVTRLKRVGDEVATLEGISVGLDDIAPIYAKRDPILASYKMKFKSAATDEKKSDVLVEAQNKILEYTQSHPGTMGEMARSGGRGNMVQLMRTVGAPVLARDWKGNVIPWMITRSYAEGLKPADAWVASTEARLNAVKTATSVVEPGDLNKILINNMQDQLVTELDCGTKNGLVMTSTNPAIVDRYLAHAAGAVARDTLITPQIATQLHKEETVVVRSPMTCEAGHGVCQKCQGLNPAGQLHSIGTNIGVRSAQAMAEPLTQMALNSKHAGRINTGKGEREVEGIKGVRQLLEIPETFLHKATLADHDGVVTKVEKAPQGGHYIFVDDTSHYVGPDLEIVAPKGTKVEAGDQLSNGIPKPDEIVMHKGLGEGRRYLVDALAKVYKSSGADLDRRHFELLAHNVLNHVTITDIGNDDEHGLLKGETVNYNKYRAALADSQKQMLLHEAVGETLGDNVFHFTAGTRITPSMTETLAKQGMKQVPVALRAPTIIADMRTASRTPLLNPDWMARLAHRYLDESLLAGAHKGEKADIHGYSPIPAYAAGGEFGISTDGKY
jgi:DNA-directed RNA polymerase subunit beta'